MFGQKKTNIFFKIESFDINLLFLSLSLSISYNSSEDYIDQLIRQAKTSATNHKRFKQSSWASVGKRPLWTQGG